MGDRIEPSEVVRAVEAYVGKELSDARQYSNREPLDESGIWSLHRLAAEVYAMGYAAGEMAESERGRYQHVRSKDRRRDEEQP